MLSFRRMKANRRRKLASKKHHKELPELATQPVNGVLPTLSVVKDRKMRWGIAVAPNPVDLFSIC